MTSKIFFYLTKEFRYSGKYIKIIKSQVLEMKRFRAQKNSSVFFFNFIRGNPAKKISFFYGPKDKNKPWIQSFYILYWFLFTVNGQSFEIIDNADGREVQWVDYLFGGF